MPRSKSKPGWRSYVAVLCLGVAGHQLGAGDLPLGLTALVVGLIYGVVDYRRKDPA